MRERVILERQPTFRKQSKSLEFSPLFVTFPQVVTGLIPQESHKIPGGIHRMPTNDGAETPAGDAAE